jgi:hypothetical protein
MGCSKCKNTLPGVYANLGSTILCQRCAGNGVLIELRKKLKSYRGNGPNIDTSRPALRPIDETNLLDGEENKEKEGGDGGHNALLALSAICTDRKRAAPESVSTKTNQSREVRRRRSRATVEPGQIRQIEEHIMDFIEDNEWRCRGDGSVRLLQADLSEEQMQRPIFRNRNKVSSDVVSSDVKKALYIVQLICQSRGNCVHNFHFLYCAFVYLGAQF